MSVASQNARLFAWRVLGVFLLSALAIPTVAFASTLAPKPTAAAPNAIGELVTSVCDKRVVLLGEDLHHGSGKTMAIKGEIVRRLITDCGFSAIFFESEIYDFLAFNRAIEAGTATQGQLANSVGGLWSTSQEIDPTLSFLFPLAETKRLTLAGLDPQIGGATQVFARTGLAAELSQVLDGHRRQRCAAEISALTNWRYDDASPYDEATKNRLRACAGDIQASMADKVKAGVTLDPAQQVMASNFAAYLEMTEKNIFNLRDRQMAQNFTWQLSRLPKGAKVLVWCASVHAAKNLDQMMTDRIPLGHYVHSSFGDGAAAIGFTALSGHYGRPGKPPTQLNVAESDSLEARALDDDSLEAKFLDAKAMDALGVTSARPINYDQPVAVRWSDYLDGIFVMREERPPTAVRPAKAQHEDP